MKITKRQLKRIIREEKQKILTEWQDSHPDFEDDPGHEQAWMGETPGGIHMTMFVNGTVYMELGRTLLEFPKSEIPHIIANLQAMLQQ